MELVTHTAQPNADRHAALAGAWLAAQTSENTRRAYARDLRAYFSFLDLGGVDALSAERRHVDLWARSLDGAASTNARRLSAVGSFYRYASVENAVSASPVVHVKRPKVDGDHSTTRGLTEAEASALLDTARDDSPRAYALVSLLLLTGVRISEALGANVSDLQHDAGHRVLVVTRKGGKRQKIALPPRVVDALGQYLGTAEAEGTALVASDQATADRPVFTTREGKRWAPSEAFRTVQRLARLAGIEGAVSPHSLRHTHATLALQEGHTLADLQDSLGHADPRTTRRYDRARGRLERSSAYAVASVLG